MEYSLFANSAEIIYSATELTTIDLSWNYMLYRILKEPNMEELKNNKSDLEEDEKQLVEEIREVGYDIDSVYDFVNNKPHPNLENKFTGSYKKAYPILVEHLKKPHHPRIKEGIVRALTEKDAAAIAKQPLLEAFQNEEDKFVKWAIANDLKYLMSK